MKPNRQTAKNRKYLLTWILLGGAGAFLLYSATIKTYQNYNLSKSGTSVFGYVIDVRRVGGKGIRRCSYVFAVNNNKYAGKVDDENLGLGDSLTIIYLPSDPEVNRAASDLK